MLETEVFGGIKGAAQGLAPPKTGARPVRVVYRPHVPFVLLFKACLNLGIL